jgi:hypothetical protein
VSPVTPVTTLAYEARIRFLRFMYRKHDYSVLILPVKYRGIYERFETWRSTMFVMGKVLNSTVNNTNTYQPSLHRGGMNCFHDLIDGRSVGNITRAYNCLTSVSYETSSSVTGGYRKRNITGELIMPYIIP